MSKRCELQKEYYKEFGNYKGFGKYSDHYVNWLESRILALTIPVVVGSALLKDLLDGSEEVITINGLRFTGTHEEKIKQVFDKHGIKYESPF